MYIKYIIFSFNLQSLNLTINNESHNSFVWIVRSASFWKDMLEHFHRLGRFIWGNNFPNLKWPIFSLHRSVRPFGNVIFHPEKVRKPRTDLGLIKKLACFSSNQTDILSFLHLFYSQTWTWHDRETHDIVCLVKWDCQLK